MIDPEQSDGERRLAAIMFTDMVGFTAFAHRNEALAMQLLEAHKRLIRPILDKHKGREIKTIGDAFMVEFASALEAVHSAVEIQSAVQEMNKGLAQDSRIEIRIGVHLGDVIHRGEDVFGDAVNVASRIEALAAPGGICITSQVHASVANRVEYGFESIGTPNLKNVATPIEVFRIAGFGGGAIAAPISAPGMLPHDRVAVLPFTNISPNQADEFFADGLTDELISSVSKIDGLRVIARTSVMQYKQASKPISQIGRELKVGSVLEGSVRKSGQQVRISVQLVDTINEEPRWSQSFDRSLNDIFSIQSEIAQSVAETLRLQVFGAAVVRIETPATQSTEGYLAYLRGRQFWNRRTNDDLRKAIRFFEEALKADPKYARAYTGLADCYASLALLEFLPPHQAFPKAKEAVSRALSIEPQLAEAHTSLGLINFQYDWDWRGAEEELRRAININPNYAPAHQFLADCLKALGRFEEALAEIEKARDLDPLSLVINTAVGHVLYLSGEFDKAIEEYRRAVELDPGFLMTHIWFGRPYLEKGMYKEAISELETAVKLSGESTLALAMLGHGLASAGQTERAEEILAQLRQRSEIQYVPSYWIAVIYNGFRDRDNVVTWMQKAFDERSSWLVWANVEPRFAWLRDDPDFAGLLGAMRFPSSGEK